MSRIDEALKRLSGVVSPESRINPPVLDRFASEGPVEKADDPKRVNLVDGRRRANLVVPIPHQAEGRVGTVKQPAEPSTPRVAETDPDGEVDGLLDVAQIVDYAGFAIRSLRRHKLLAAGTFAAVLALTLAVALLVPKKYYVQVKLLAQRNAVMAALSNPGRAVPWDADAPTRAAAETVLRRDNLIALISQTDLINEWDRRRAPVVRLRDWFVTTVLGRQVTVDDKVDALVERLEDNMLVTAGPVGDGTVTIELYWPDPEMAFELVERAQQAFLEARQVAETSAIAESIAILERYSASLRQDANRTLSELDRTQARDGVARAPRAMPRRQTALPVDVTTPVSTGAAAFVPDPEVSRVRTELSAKRQELTRLQEGRQRELSELQAKMAAMLTVYTPSHPSVLSLQQNIAALQQPSPQIATLKAAIEDREAEFDRIADADAERMVKAELGRRGTSAPTVHAPILEPEPVDLTVASPVTGRRNESSEFASMRLKTELNQLQSILERTDGARIELAVSEAAFKYRYTVIKPAQEPREPHSPNLRLVMLAGVLAAMLLAFAAAVGSDLLSNRILEAWQVKRQLGLPILGTVRMV